MNTTLIAIICLTALVITQAVVAFFVVRAKREKTPKAPVIRTGE